jgi:hypothetical protein
LRCRQRDSGNQDEHNSGPASQRLNLFLAHGTRTSNKSSLRLGPYD